MNSKNIAVSIFIRSEGEYLFLQRTSTLTAGTWAIPGGRLATDELRFPKFIGHFFLCEVIDNAWRSDGREKIKKNIYRRV